MALVITNMKQNLRFCLDTFSSGLYLYEDRFEIQAHSHGIGNN